MLKNERVIVRDYRNRRIGDFLKELELTEGGATGFPKIYVSVKRNSSPEQNFEMDEERIYFLAILPIHPDAQTTEQGQGQAKANNQKYHLNKTEGTILAYLEKGSNSRSDIVADVDSGSRSGYFKQTLQELLEKELIERIHPDSPTHPHQKYQITDAGRQQVES